MRAGEDVVIEFAHVVNRLCVWIEVVFRFNLEFEESNEDSEWGSHLLYISCTHFIL